MSEFAARSCISMYYNLSNIRKVRDHYFPDCSLNQGTFELLMLNSPCKTSSVFADGMLMYDSIEGHEQKIKEQEVIIDVAKKIINDTKAEIIKIQDAGAAAYVIWCDQAAAAAVAKVPGG